MEKGKESPTFSKRKEKKFIIDREAFLKLKSIFDDPQGIFKKDYPDKNSDLTHIENIYFDSSNLKSYHLSATGDESRFKFRVRSYSQNEDLVYLEIKSRNDGQTTKERVVFRKIWMEEFLTNGSFPEESFVLLNSDKPPIKSLEILKSLSTLIHDLNFRPVLRTNYTRYAYKLRKFKSIRITIDKNLNFASLTNDLKVEVPYESTILPDQYIVEVKYLSDEDLLRIPQVMEFLTTPKRFSKYCFGLYNEYLKRRSSPATESTDMKTLKSATF